MATSKSFEARQEWEASAGVFSGRPDPRWTPDRAAVEHLERLWKSLPPCAEVPPSAPPVGYRGSSLRDPGGRRWFAFGGIVTRGGPDDVESRRDEGRVFEKAILDSAPEGLVPPPFITID
jgi:hypothetical protein